MCASLDECAYQIAHHVVEESVGGDTVEEETIGDVPLGVGDGADGGLGFDCGAVGEVRVGGGESGEVVGAEDVGGSLVECVEIERPGAGPDGGGQGGGTDSIRF